jgi:hypothetical protein
MLEIDSVAKPELKRVIPLGALLVPTIWLANVTLVVLKLTADAVAVPVSEAVCGLPDALSLTETVACREPEAIGVNVTLIVQLVASASELPQLFVWEKSPGFAPVMVILVMVKVALPVLLSVTSCGALLPPRTWLPNTRLVGDKVAVGAMPVPVSGTLCGLPAALSVTLTLAVRVPLAVGVKVTLIEHDAPAATDDPHVLVWE